MKQLPFLLTLAVSLMLLYSCEPCKEECYPIHCFNGILDDNETGIDCGGPCPDCSTLCGDGELNGNEEEIDCGGPDCPPCPPNTDWPQIGYNAQRTSFNPFEHKLGLSNVEDLEILWTKHFSSTIRSGVSVVDGVAYFGTYGGEFMAANANNGEVLWEKHLNGKHQGHAIVDDVAYVTSRYMLYALEASSGATFWTYDFDANDVGCPVVAEGMVYVPGADALNVLDATTGTMLWNVAPRGGFAIADGIVYKGGVNVLQAFDAQTGELLWTSTDLEGEKISGPRVADGLVYVHSDAGYLYAFKAEGCVQELCEPLWIGETMQSGAEGPQPPAVAYGKVYVGSNSTFYAFNTDCNSSICTPCWTTNTACSFYPGSPPSVANGVVYSTCDNNYIYAFNASTGKILWQYYTDGGYPMRSSPTIADGKLFHAATFDFTLYAFHVPD